MKFYSIKIFSLYFIFYLGCASSAFRSPKVVTKGNPDYPLSAQLERAEGEVLLAVFVNSEGYVEEVEYLNSSGRDDLDVAASEFAEGLVFKPATLNGSPLSVWTKLVLRFKLTEMMFDEQRWLFEVFDLQRKIEQESTPQEKERLFKKLYTCYHGLLIHVQKHPDPKINRSIRKVVDPNIIKHWQGFWRQYPLAFAVLEDFLQRYPKSQITPDIRERLIKELVDLRFEIMNLTKSTSSNNRNARFVQALEMRMKALGGIIPDPI